MAEKGMIIFKELFGAVNALDENVAWNQIYDIIVDMDRYQTDYSDEVAVVIRQTKGFLMDGVNYYLSATQNFLKWSDVASTLLRAYRRLPSNTESQSNTRKKLLLSITKEGKVVMEKSQYELGDSLKSFDDAIGALKLLTTRLDEDFAETRFAHFLDIFKNHYFIYRMLCKNVIVAAYKTYRVKGYVAIKWIACFFS